LRSGKGNKGSVREQRRSAGELGPDQVVLQATNQLGAKYEPPLAVGDRLRLFARTNARCTDGLRGVIGVNGSVLEVTAIGAESLWLRSASGRERLVAWDTLRDRESGRLQLTYGDAPSSICGRVQADRYAYFSSPSNRFYPLEERVVRAAVGTQWKRRRPTRHWTAIR
jgi:hypothetical protein